MEMQMQMTIAMLLLWRLVSFFSKVRRWSPPVDLCKRSATRSVLINRRLPLAAATFPLMSSLIGDQVIKVRRTRRVTRCGTNSLIYDDDDDDDSQRPPSISVIVLSFARPPDWLLLLFRTESRISQSGFG